MIVVRALPKPPTPEQLDQLTDALADQGAYAQRAWHLCGSGAK